MQESGGTKSPVASNVDPKKLKPGKVNLDRLTRLDHRKSNQFRPFKCEQGILKQADGSARFSHGHTSVMTAVYGPMQCVRSSQEKIDRCFVEVVFNSAVDDDTQKNKESSEILRRTVESIVMSSSHPRTLLRIVVQVIKDDGSALAVATNCVSMALMDAGFPMKSFALGVTCLVTPKETTLDPTLLEEGEIGATRVFAVFDGNGGDIITTIAAGIMKDDNVFCKAIDTLGDAAGTVAAFVRMAIEQKYPIE